MRDMVEAGVAKGRAVCLLSLEHDCVGAGPGPAQMERSVPVPYTGRTIFGQSGIGIATIESGSICITRRLL